MTWGFRQKVQKRQRGVRQFIKQSHTCISISKNVIFNPILPINIMSISWENALMWLPQNPLIRNQVTLFQAMAWCHQSTRQCPNRSWPNNYTLRCYINLSNIWWYHMQHNLKLVSLKTHSPCCNPLEFLPEASFRDDSTNQCAVDTSSFLWCYLGGRPLYGT